MGLDAKIELSLEGRRIMVVSVHPQTCMEAVADMLEDLATDIRRDLRSKTPILTLPQRLHEIDTSSHSPTPPAAFIGTSLQDQYDAADAKLQLAMDYGDAESVQKYWGRCEKLYEWMVNNYTKEAIKNGPVPTTD